MSENEKLTARDIRSALKQIGVYVDVTEDDLMKIYELALEHAKKEARWKIPVKGIMTKEVVTIGEETTLHQMSALMNQHRISGLPVTDRERHVIGIVTEADLIATICIKRGYSFIRTLKYLFGESLQIPEPAGNENIETTARDVMKTRVITAAPDDDVSQVAAIMDEKKIKRLPVVGPDGKLSGIISRADIVRAIGV